MGFNIQILGLQTAGKLSNGIGIGLETGFDSGTSLDYVYENRARGITPLGRLIDRCHLNAVGWKGVRQRKVHLSQTLKTLSESILESGQEVRILDVATGCGRYVLEVLSELRGRDVQALLRDWEPRNLEQGQSAARELELENAVFERGDAFDKESLLATAPRPNIAIVSGLYELFPDNSIVLSSLAGIAGVLLGHGHQY